MKIERLNHPTPAIVVDDFLDELSAASILSEAIALEPVYRPASVLDSKNGSIVNNKVRKNEVVYLDEVFKGNRDRCKVFKHFNDKLYNTPEVWRAGNTGFEIIGRATRWETVLSRYGNGDFYDFHCDYNFQKANRLITAVYYVNTGAFTGGELVLKGEPNVAIEAKHNRLLIFNSGAYHSVSPTTIPSDSFQNGRFSINLWIGFNT